MNDPTPIPIKWQTAPPTRVVLGHVSFEPPSGHIRGTQQLGRHLAHVTAHRGEPAQALARELAPPKQASKSRYFTRPVAKVARSTTKSVAPAKKP